MVPLFADPSQHPGSDVSPQNVRDLISIISYAPRQITPTYHGQVVRRYLIFGTYVRYFQALTFRRDTSAQGDIEPHHTTSFSSAYKDQ